MYATHTTKGHAKWRKEQDEKNALKYEAHKLKRAGSPPAAGAEPETKKLALPNKLRTALTFKAGLSNKMYNSIWKEANRDSGMPRSESWVELCVPNDYSINLRSAPDSNDFNTSYPNDLNNQDHIQ